MSTRDPRDPPGAAQDRTTLVAELAELERVIEDYAPHSPFCDLANAALWPGPDVETATCPCWKGRAMRIIKFGVRA